MTALRVRLLEVAGKIAIEKGIANVARVCAWAIGIALPGIRLSVINMESFVVPECANLSAMVREQMH